MAPNENADLFDTSAALAVLDGILGCVTSQPLPGAESAWDAAWIACLTGSPAWAATASGEFAVVIAELGDLLRAGASSSADNGWRDARPGERSMSLFERGGEGGEQDVARPRVGFGHFVAPDVCVTVV